MIVYGLLSLFVLAVPPDYHGGSSPKLECLPGNNQLLRHHHLPIGLSPRRRSNKGLFVQILLTYPGSEDCGRTRRTKTRTTSPCRTVATLYHKATNTRGLHTTAKSRAIAVAWETFVPKSSHTRFLGVLSISDSSHPHTTFTPVAHAEKVTGSNNSGSRLPLPTLSLPTPFYKPAGLAPAQPRKVPKHTKLAPTTSCPLG